MITSDNVAVRFATWLNLEFVTYVYLSTRIKGEVDYESMENIEYESDQSDLYQYETCGNGSFS